VAKLTVPEGATAVRSESTPAKGYMLIFTMPKGEVKMRCGPDMLRAMKLVSIASRVIKSRKAAS
jgi:hypothetical protein